MKLEFMKFAPTDAGAVDSHFKLDDPRVLLKLDEVPAPLYPGEEALWSEIIEVAEQVDMARRKADCVSNADCLQNTIISEYGRVDQIAITKMHHAADLVHHDLPTEIMMRALKFALRDKETTFKPYAFAQPSIFTDKVVLLNALCAQATYMISPTSFAFKWHYKVARPEEAVAAILDGSLPAPEWVEKELLTLIEDPDKIAADYRNFTMYSEGCPPHPSYWAMHSCAAGAFFAAMMILLDMSEKVFKDSMNAAYNVAFNRSIAGVHYRQDNLVGLDSGFKAGTKFVKQQMIDYGATMAEVEAAVEGFENVSFTGSVNEYIR